MATISSVITSDFTGWSGETVFVLQNGQVWQQSQYAYMYMYAYRPSVTIEATGNSGIMTVNGRSVKVTKLK